MGVATGPGRHAGLSQITLLWKHYLMARLAALVPPSRMHLTRFHAVFAPHSKLRAAVTPAHRSVGSKTDPANPEQPITPRHLATTWAQRQGGAFESPIRCRRVKLSPQEETRIMRPSCVPSAVICTRSHAPSGSGKRLRTVATGFLSLALVAAVAGCQFIGPAIREDVLNCRGQPDSSESRAATCMAAATYDIAQERAAERQRSSARGAFDGDCVRPPPMPVFRAGIQGVASHSFQPLPNREAVERVTLTQGLAVAVSHGGCAHYVLTYSFEVGNIPTPDGPGLLRWANSLLSILVAVDPESVPQELLGIIDNATRRDAYAAGDLLLGADTNRWAVVVTTPADTAPGTVKVTYEIAF